MYSYFFGKKLLETIEDLEQLIFFSSAIDELPNKQNVFESSEVDEKRKLHNPHHLLSREIAQKMLSTYRFLKTEGCRLGKNTLN